MADKKTEDGGGNVEITLKNVRLSFANLFKATKFGNGDGEDKPKFNCSLLLKKATQKDQIDAVKAAMKKAAKAKWGDDIPKFKEEKLCIRNGEPVDEESGAPEALYDGYEGCMYVSASNAKRPAIVDRRRNVLTEEDGKPYSGCYVNATIRIWAQDNSWGKRINASLEAVQFVKDGDAFGAKPVDPNDAFEDLGDDEDGDDAPKGNKKSAKADEDDLL